MRGLMRKSPPWLLSSAILAAISHGCANALLRMVSLPLPLRKASNKYDPPFLNRKLLLSEINLPYFMGWECRPEALSPLALKHSQDLVNLMSSLDQLMTHITTVDMTTATASLNQLSPDILKEKVADILFNGSTFQALNTMINPESQVSTRYGRPTTPTDQPSGSTTSVIRLLCARLHFIGYLKHNLWRIGISINSGEITVCAEIGQNESKAHLDAFNNRIPFVPMGMEGMT